MTAHLVHRIMLAGGLAVPALVLRSSGVNPGGVIDLVAFGAAIVGAAFILAWAADAARTDISGPLAVAVLALVAVLPEYAVDLYYAYRSGSDPSYEQYAAANMTGSNRLLLGVGWPLVVLLALAAYRWRRSSGGTRSRSALLLPASSRVDIGVLGLVGLAAFVIPFAGEISLLFGLVLIAVFLAYLWRLGHVRDDSAHPVVGTAAAVAALPTAARRGVIVAMFAVSAVVILLCAQPFADALVTSGAALGVDSFVLVQWLAPLASEAPEFIVAIMFAVRGMGAAAIATLIAAKVNQWTLLVGSLPVAHAAGGGGTALGLDPRQVEEFALTATQTMLGVAIIVSLRLHRRTAIVLLGTFALQFVVTGTTGRLVLAAAQLLAAAVVFWVCRAHLVAAVTAPFRRPVEVSRTELVRTG
ncbi:MAG: sodium:proton exchanger [Actinomycetota bacterium]|nr:MAG: sodium:proton exchanger [Actinomycetota bacterium]